LNFQTSSTLQNHGITIKSQDGTLLT